MALSSNFISFMFFTTLLLPLQINARESQFFSKVTNVNNNNAKETTVLPNKEEPVNKPEQQQQPAFIPETENSYGLYGHDESNVPFTKITPTTNYQPYKTTTEFEDTSKYHNNNNKYFNYDNNDNAYYNTNNQNEFSNTRLTGTGYYSNNNKNNYNYNNNYNKDAFGNGYQNELSDTKYTEGSGYNSMENQNNNNQMYYYNSYNNERSTYNNNNNAANIRHNGERQGMSDTRFMEDGKYFFDTTSERYNTPLHGDAYRGLNNENWYNNNNNNNYNHGNYNEYQNQENFEDEP